MNLGTNDLILLGSEQEFTPEHLKTMERRFENQAIKTELKKIQITSPTDIVAREVWNAPGLYTSAALHTLDMPKLSYAAGKDFFKEVHTPLARLLERDRENVWLSDFASRSLLAKYEALHAGDTVETKLNRLKVYCETSSFNELPANWHDSSPNCRHSIVNALREGWLKPKFSQGESFAQAILGNPKDRVWTPEDSRIFLSAYLKLHSGYSPIAKQQLDEKSRPCYLTSAPDAVCIALHIKSLYKSGYEQEAQDTYSRYAAELSKRLDTASLQNFELLQARAKEFRELKATSTL